MDSYHKTKSQSISKQGCIPVGCVPPACWPYPVVLGGLPNPQSMQTPPKADPPGGRDSPPEADLPPVNRMTHRWKNMTFPQTSFEGGNNSHIDFHHKRLLRMQICSVQKALTGEQ